MKQYYEQNNWSSSLAYYRIEGKVVCVVYEIIQVLDAPMTQCVYNLDSIMEHLQNPATTISYRGHTGYINGRHHQVDYMSTYKPYHLELNRKQFSRTLEIK